MANLRIFSVTATDSQTIVARFTDSLSQDISPANLSIDPQTPGVQTPVVTKLTIIGDTLTATVQPLVPLAAYFVSFQSVPGTPFQSLNGTSQILNDGLTNRQLILGPIEDDNPIRDYLDSFLKNNVYDLQSPSVVSTYLDGLSTVLAQALYDVRQVKNENYLGYEIVDEIHTRGSGGFDRLNEESAYQILRVGKVPTGTTSSSVQQIASFPTYPVSLRATAATETLLPSNSDPIGTFNLQTLTLNLTHNLITALSSITFIYGVASSYQYNIDGYGYQLLDSTYDPDHAFTYLQLASNQARLSTQVLADPNFQTDGITQIRVSYQFKDTSRNIDPTTLILDTVLSSGRETVPPLENIFTLAKAPIVTTGDQLGTIGDVSFIDPNAYPNPSTSHPAFTTEVPFRWDYLPSLPGQYSVDYQTGNVYCYGADSTNTGTGPEPPVAIYSYRHVFSELIDYVYDQDAEDVVYLPNGSLWQAQTNLSYQYEQVLASGVDYQSAAHIEVLAESVGNRLVALNSIQTQQSPITDVFRILNQTTGEVYNVSRWSDTQLYFTYQTAPNIQSLTGERVRFDTVSNETLFVSQTTVVSPSLMLFQMDLANNQLIGQTQDCIGSLTNSSVGFSDQNVFARERYWDGYASLSANQSHLTTVGDYQVDYQNGVVYCLVTTNQSIAVGQVSYRRGYIAPANPHVITVYEIYYRLTPQGQKGRTTAYRSFTDGSILPASFDLSNEEYLNDNTAYPYQLHDGQVGTFGAGAVFVPGVTLPVSYVRGLFEYEDLVSNPQPINFATSTTVSGNIITTAPLTHTEYHSVAYNGTAYYVMANQPLLFQSPNVTMAVTITRLSDSAVLWSQANPGTIQLGSPFVLILSGVGSPHVNDPVSLTYTFAISDLSRVVVDYNRGDLYLDYSYLADELVVSYEYGQNQLDFRQSTALNPGDTYYVTYRVGALRRALLQNFGTLIDVPILNSLDITLPRERYRDALMAAMQSFTAGPSLTSMRAIVQNIVHTPPDIIESAFENWTIGQSLLNPEPMTTQGAFALARGRYGSGVVIDQPGQQLSLPLSSNLRLNEGTFECWISPEWNGIDNQSDVTVTITRDGYLLPRQSIFIGPAGAHPQYSSGSFMVSTSNLTSVLGQPNEHRDGVFVYLAPDPTGAFNRWYVDVRDSSGVSHQYVMSLRSTGRFYDVKSTTVPQPTGVSIQSGTGSFQATIGGSDLATGVTFVADDQHYILDAGEEKRNRISLFKDESGYVSFRVMDRHGRQSVVSADVSQWLRGQLHHVAAAWKLANLDGRDELHLFVDGAEVPNIIRYGNNTAPYLHERFRTINPEDIVGHTPRPVVGSTDLTATAGSQLVSSLINFSGYGILPGDVLTISEPGFSTYVVSGVAGQQLTLSTPMPQTITNGTFSVNQQTFETQTGVDLFPNISLSRLPATLVETDLTTTVGSNILTAASTNFTTVGIQPGYLIHINGPADGYATPFTIVAVSGQQLTINGPADASGSGQSYAIYPNLPVEIPGPRALHPDYQIGRDGYCQPTITLTNGISANDLIIINTLGINHRHVTESCYLWGSSQNVLMTALPPPLLLCEVSVTHGLMPLTVIGPANSTLSGGVFTSTAITTDQPSTSDNGRTLSVYVSGDNINYAAPVTVSIRGTVAGVPNTTESVAFDFNDTQQTSSRFSQVSSVTVVCTPVNPAVSCCVVSVEEALPVTTAEDSQTVAAIRYSYQVSVGNSLTGSGTVVTDTNQFFSRSNIGNYLIITKPVPAAGQYLITDVSTDHQSLTLATSVPVSLTAGQYQILDVQNSWSGFQNGFFTFELAGQPGQPYLLTRGNYRFDYSTSLSIPFDVTSSRMFLGTDIHGRHTVNALIDEVMVVGERLTDTRVGETTAVNQQNLTKDYNSLVPLRATDTTLLLYHLDAFPFVNAASPYTQTTDQYIVTGSPVNDNFDRSLVCAGQPFVIDNTGILGTQNQGTVEFWISPTYDTGNDPSLRYYFDASSLAIRTAVSRDRVTIILPAPVGQIQSIHTTTGDQSVDYFAGGLVSTDGRTITLNRALPSQQTPVVVSYIPRGSQGDRLSIYKDQLGYLCMVVQASGTTFQIRNPIFWTRGTWHRVKVTFQFNAGIGRDQIRLYVDGSEFGNILLGSSPLLFGQGLSFQSIYQGRGNPPTTIQFRDTINELFVGTDFTGANPAAAQVSNLRISDTARPVFTYLGESVDIHYTSNLSLAFPVVADLYTTYLLDLKALIRPVESFATLRNRQTGSFDFTVDIFDSFGIVASNTQVKTILETLIDTLKPANSTAILSYPSTQAT